MFPVNWMFRLGDSGVAGLLSLGPCKAVFLFCGIRGLPPVE